MIQTLHSLRFVFIMLIVFSHIIGKRFDFGGECGVSFFFMLSGFVLSLAYGQRVESRQFSLRSFLLRQLSKFYPLHLLMLVAFVCFDARLGVFYDWQHLLPNIFLLQSWIPYDEYFFVANGSSWFLCDIVFFYLVFCLAYRWLNRMRILDLLLLGIVVLTFYGFLAYSIPIWKVNSILYASPATRLIDFCIGILLFRLFRSDVGSRLEHWMEGKGYLTMTLWEFLFVALLVVSFFIYESMSLRLRCAALFWLFLPLLLLFFSVSDKHGGWLTRLLHHPVLLWFGSISLEIYLVHMLVLRIVYGVMRSAGFDNALLLIVTVLSVLFPVAWLTKRFFVDKVYFFLNKFVP